MLTPTMRFWGKTQRSAQPREHELDVLVAYSRALVSAAATGEIAHAMFRAFDDLFGTEQAMLLMIDDVDDVAVSVATTGVSGAPTDGVRITLAADTSAISQVIRERVHHRIVDARRESLHAAALDDVMPFRSAVYLPLTTPHGVLAVAVVGTRNDVRVFSRDEAELMQTIAHDAAAALERVRYAQALKDVGERDLVVASVARTLRESLDPDHLVRAAARELGEQTDADRVMILVPGGDGTAGITCEWSAAGIVQHPGEPVLDTAAQLAVSDRQVVATRAFDDASHAESTRLTVPLTRREATLGVISIDRAHAAFAQSESALVSLVCAEVAASLEHVQLYQRGRRHLDEQMALARAAQSLTADLRFDRVLEHVVDEAVKVLRTSSAAFYVYDRDEATLTLSAAFGQHESEIVGLTIPLVGLAGRVVRTGVAQFTNDYIADIGEEVHASFASVTRACAVPVRWQGDLRGVITVAARDRDGAFTEHDLSLLEAFADLASLALHNAEAYRTNARQARIQAGFYRISQMLSASLGRQETLSTLAQAAAEALDASWTLVTFDVDDSASLQVEGAWQVPDRISAALDKGGYAWSGSPAAVARRVGRIITSRDVRSDERLAERWRTLLADAGVASLLAVPVVVRGRHTATVVACFDRDVRFGDEELVVASNLASAAAAAFDRASLFENERRARQLAEVLADVSAMLAETLKTQQVLERIVQQAAVLLEVDACSLAVADARVAQSASVDAVIPLDVRAVYGSDSVLVQALQDASAGSLVEETSRAKQPVFIGELASETAGQALGDAHYDAFLGVPLLHPRGYLVGVLSAYGVRRRAWTAPEIASLESFASSAAIAIRNAELYANVQRERDTIEKLLASIGEGIVATDDSGRITLWNRAAEEMTGIVRDRAIGRAWKDVLGLAPDTAVEDGESVVAAQPDDGPRMWLSMTAATLREKERITGAIYAFRDVSADYMLDQLKRDFVSTVSYLLRTPLTSILGFAHTLLRDDVEFDADARQTFVEYILQETQRLSGIVDDLLQVASIDAGTVEVSVGDCELSPLVDEVVDDAQSRTAGGAILTDGIEGVAVRADADKLQLVLTNLVDNALRFSPTGGDVRISAHRDNGAVQLSVSDSGIGIPHAELKHLFTKFYVAPSTGELAGSGLGLYISRGLVNAMGGRIWADSHPGAGSTFTLELPAARAEDVGTAEVLPR